MNNAPVKGISGEELVKRLGMGEKTGKWVEVGSAFPRVRCSECRTVFQYRVQERDSCPVCGAVNEKTEDYYE